MNENPFLIRDEIDERSHRLIHLKKSQDELKYFILQQPEDLELSTAFYENSLIINRIENEIISLKEELVKIDPAYSIESRVVGFIQPTEIFQRRLPEEMKEECQGVYL
jgi:flagellar assembly factor FliW